MSASIDICRGDIHYIRRGVAVGAEIKKGRPGVIISNDTSNRNDGVVTIIPLTSQEKREHPTRVRIHIDGGVSTALCEQVTCIDKSRVGDRMGSVTVDEMRKIERGVAYALALGHDEIYAAQRMVGGGKTKAEVELETTRDLYNKLLEAIAKGGFSRP